MKTARQLSRLAVEKEIADLIGFWTSDQWREDAQSDTGKDGSGHDFRI